MLMWFIHFLSLWPNMSAKTFSASRLHSVSTWVYKPFSYSENSLSAKHFNTLTMSTFTRSLVSRNWWDEFDVPHRLRDQHFGIGLTDLDLDASPSFYRGYYLRPRRQLSSGGTSEVKADPSKFQVIL